MEQALTVQAPDVHADVALARAHARPQAPQFAALVFRLASQPVLATLSQSPKPASQRCTVQAPPPQPSVAWASVQTLPQLPQFAGSTDTFAQYCAGAVPQVLSGAAHVVVHAPREQT